MNPYRQSQISTASPGQRVVMMYEALCRELHKAEDACIKIPDDTSQIEVAHNALVASDRIITELRVALDMEQGGELAKSLEGLYDFWIRHLSDANRFKDPKRVAEVLKMAQELRETWREAAAKARNGEV
jgi:flagellar protein FliS